MFSAVNRDIMIKNLTMINKNNNYTTTSKNKRVHFKIAIYTKFSGSSWNVFQFCIRLFIQPLQDFNVTNLCYFS